MNIYFILCYLFHPYISLIRNKRIEEFSDEVKTLLLIQNDGNETLNQYFSNTDLNI